MEIRTSDDFEAWRAFARPFFDVQPKDPVDTFHSRVHSTKSRRLILSDVAFCSTLFVRDRKTIEAHESSYLLLERYTSGENRGRAGEVDTRLDTSSIHFIDMSRPYQTLTSAAECRSVVIPHDAIGYDPGMHDRYVRLECASPRGALMDAALSAMFDARDRGERRDVDALADSFTGLLRRLMLCLPGLEVDDDAERGSELIARRHISRRLGEPGLDPEWLSAELGISRASLYRMFEPRGGVARYINERRLDQCFRDLREGPIRRGRVREVAERWGFLDAANFNRRFRARFGMAPSDCLDLRKVDRIDESVGRAIGDWMGSL